MDIRLHSTVLVTRRFGEMKRFYTGLLGQRVRLDFGNCVTLECALTLWELRQDYVLSRTLHVGEERPGNGSMEICFETDDFDADTARVKAGGVTLLHDIAEETWGQRTLRFFDPDGNIVELGESMPCFCRRLRDSGLGAAEVAQITGIPVETVNRNLAQ